MCFHPPHDPSEISGSGMHRSLGHSLRPSLRDPESPHSSQSPSSGSYPDRPTRPLLQPSPLQDLRPHASMSTARHRSSQQQRIPTTMFQLSEAPYETFVVASPQARVSTSAPGVPIGGAALGFRGETPHRLAHFRDSALDIDQEVYGSTQYTYPFPPLFQRLGHPRDVGDEDHRNLQPPRLTPVPQQTQPEPTTSSGITETSAVPHRPSFRRSVPTQPKAQQFGRILEGPDEAASGTTQVPPPSLPVRGGRRKKITEASAASKRPGSGRDKQGCLTCRARRKVSLSTPPFPWFPPWTAHL